MDITGTLAFRIPVLPDTSPESSTPACFNLPLLPHQRRALRRMQQVEGDGAFTEQSFGTAVDMSARGGVLADAVGMGKTAVTLALIASEPLDLMVGPNLIVLPKHLIAQWKKEAEKFVASGELDVIVGRDEYESHLKAATNLTSNRTVVLVPVTEVLGAPSLHYDFRRLFARVSVDPKEKKRGEKLTRGEDGQWYGLKDVTHTYSVEKLAEYRKAAIFVNGGYTGKVYSGILHWPEKNWRRVILDEVQDLCRPNTEAQDNFVQLTRRASNVWLISATPFPLGDRSIYANHQLLGFHRFRLSVQHAGGRLPDSHPFEIIKRRLYVRSTDACHRQTIASNVEVREETLEIEMHGVERVFYENLVDELGGADEATSFWDESYNNLRQTCCHPAASSQIREEMISMNADGNQGVTDLVSCMRHSLVNLAKRAFQRLQVDTIDTSSRVENLEKNILWTDTSMKVANIMLSEITAMGAEGWDLFRRRTMDQSEDDFQEARLPLSEEELLQRMSEGDDEANGRKYTRIVLRQHYDGDPRSAHDTQNYCFGYRTCARYVCTHWSDESSVEKYLHELTKYAKARQTILGQTQLKLERLEKSTKRFADFLEGGMRMDRTLAGKFGSKPAALVEFVQKNLEEKIIGTPNEHCMRSDGAVHILLPPLPEFMCVLFAHLDCQSLPTRPLSTESLLHVEGRFAAPGTNSDTEQHQERALRRQLRQSAESPLPLRERARLQRPLFVLRRQRERREPPACDYCVAARSARRERHGRLGHEQAGYRPLCAPRADASRASRALLPKGHHRGEDVPRH